jgi:hypothetical protein
LPAAGYSQERYLKEHLDYYWDVWVKTLGNQQIDFKKIPTAKFEYAYDMFYSKLPLGKARTNYRKKNKWFDLEGAKLGHWKVLK